MAILSESIYTNRVFVTSKTVIINILLILLISKCVTKANFFKINVKKKSMSFIKTFKKKYFSIVLFYLLVNTCYGSNLNIKEKIETKNESLEMTAKIIDFSNEINFKHIEFSKLIPNNFTKKINHINIDVNNSSSFLVIPFEDIVTTNRVSFLWKSKGLLNIKDKKHEKSKLGDDAILRIGLITMKKNSNRIISNIFVKPGWLRDVEETLVHKAGSLMYLLPKTKNKYPETWNSPYSTLIKMIPTKTIFSSNDWNKSSITFKKYFEVIGVIIMADGDNTNSKFETQLKSISLDFKY